MESPPAAPPATAGRRWGSPGAAPALGGHALAAFAYLALTLWFLRPIASVYATHIAPDLGDPLFNLVILKWGIHQFGLGLADFWNAPFFFPAQGVITYSDHLLGPAALAWLLRGVLPNPLAAYNLLLLASFVVSAWSTWFVLRRGGVGVAAAFLGGLMFAFSPFRWDQMSHLQVLLMLWIPLLLWSWDRLLAAPSWRRALVFLVFYALHGTGGAYLAYMVHVPMAILLLVRGKALWHGTERRRALAVLAPTGLACLALMLVLFLPYAQRSGQQSRRQAEIVSHGASLASFVSAPPSLLYGDLTVRWRRNENTLFAGLVATALGLLAVHHGWRGLPRRARLPLSRRRRATIGFFAAIAALAFVLAEVQTWAFARGWTAWRSLHLPEGHRLGVLLLLSALTALVLRRRWGGNWPVRFGHLDPWRRGLLISTIVCTLLTFPAIYLALMRIVPGLAGMRVPTRFYAFVSFGIVWFAAHALDRLLAGLPTGRRRWVAAGITALALLELNPKPWNWFALPPPSASPPVYRWLKDTPEVRSTLELPIDDNMDQIQYLYFWSSHWKPLVNGYSGFLAPHFEQLRLTGLRPAPNAKELANLRAWGVTHLVVHRAHLDRKQRFYRFWRWVEREDIPLVYDDSQDLVFSLIPGAAAAPGLRLPRERSFRDVRSEKSPRARRPRSAAPPPGPRTPRTPPPPPGR